MPGTFEIFKDKKGEFRFRLKASNGEIILASEGYKAKTGVKNGVASVMKNGGLEERFEKKPGAGGKFRFLLKAGNRQIIGTSEAYETERACQNGINSVMKNAPNAKIVDTTT
ncbi:MAG: YegP family protein [Hyphomonadaceae bacterium]